MKLYEQPAHVLHDMLVNKEITALQLTEAVLARIDEVEGDVKAYLTITRDEAIAQAKAVDEKIAKGEDISFLEDMRIIYRTIFKVAHQDDINTDGMETAEDYGDWLLRKNLISEDIYLQKSMQAIDMIKHFCD